MGLTLQQKEPRVRPSWLVGGEGNLNELPVNAALKSYIDCDGPEPHVHLEQVEKAVRLVASVRWQRAWAQSFMWLSEPHAPSQTKQDTLFKFLQNLAAPGACDR